MMKKLEPVVIEPITITTAWWGDPSINREASDLAKWCETADTNCLVLNDGAEPLAPITIRGLTERELSQLGDTDTAAANVARFYQATRFGLISAGFVTMRRTTINGIPGLQDRTLDQLTRYVEDLPMALAWRTMGRAAGISEEDTGADLEALIRTDLAMWLGTHVLALTFRARNHAP